MFTDVNACYCGFNCAFVACGGIFSSNKQTEKISNSKLDEIKQKLNEIKQKFNFKTFDISSNDIEKINKPFYHFIKSNNIVKIGKQHRNPFLNIDLNKINIALFGDVKVNKSDLAFRLVYDEFYEHFYNDFKVNYKDFDLSKVIEINSKMQNIRIIDSSYVTNIEKKLLFISSRYYFCF